MPIHDALVSGALRDVARPQHVLDRVGTVLRGGPVRVPGAAHEHAVHAIEVALPPDDTVEHALAGLRELQPFIGVNRSVQGVKRFLREGSMLGTARTRHPDLPSFRWDVERLYGTHGSGQTVYGALHLEDGAGRVLPEQPVAGMARCYGQYLIVAHPRVALRSLLASGDTLDDDVALSSLEHLGQVLIDHLAGDVPIVDDPARMARGIALHGDDWTRQLHHRYVEVDIDGLPIDDALEIRENYHPAVNGWITDADREEVSGLARERGIAYREQHEWRGVEFVRGKVDPELLWRPA